MSLRTTGSVVLFAALVLAPAVRGQDPKLIDTSFVGQWMVFFNPTQGGGTQMLNVDIHASGSYLATDMHGEKPPTLARFEAAEGKFRLLSSEGSVLDQGSYEPFGPQIQLTSPLGKGHWTKVSAESKQSGTLKDAGTLKSAKFEPIAEQALQNARKNWLPDAVLVEAKTVPNPDGTLDLTVPGGNGILRFHSPSKNQGCLGMMGTLGEVNLFPETQPVSASRWSLPKNVISLERAIGLAEAEQPGPVKEAALYGCGADPDLRQFCWVFTKADSVVAVDAILGNIADYREFMDGRERARKVPFAANRGYLVFRHSYDGSGPPEVLWYARHVVHLEGFDEAIVVMVPWRVVPHEELMKHADKTGSGITYRGDQELYPEGEFAPLEGAVREAFLRDKDSIPIACPPFGVRTKNPLDSYPPGTKDRIIKQLESHWRSTGAKPIK